MESSKTTACHIKQVAGDPQAAQINLLRHQCTELPAGKYKKKKSSVKPRQSNYKNHGSENSQAPSQNEKQFDVMNAHKNKDRCLKCGDSAHIEGFQCPAKSSNAKLATSLDILPAFVSRKKQAPFKSKSQKHTNYKQGQYMPKIVPFAVNLMMTVQAKIPFVCRSK